MYRTKIGVHNSSRAPRVIYVEPWANDYTLMPGEELIIEACGAGSMPWFNVQEWADDTQVYCENAVDFRVIQQGAEIGCGHKRQPGSSAGPVIPEP
jgi:hypothetical protein